MSADEGVLLLELENAMREFFIESQAWQEELGPYDIVQNTDLELDDLEQLQDDEISVAYVKEVRVGEWYATPITKDPGPVDEVSAEERSDLYYYCPQPNVIHFEPPMDGDLSGITYVRAVLRPKNCRSIIPDYVGTHFFEAIIDGTLGKLYAYNSDFPFSDTTAAGYHLRRFRTHIVQWKDQANRKFTTADAAWRFPQSGGWV
jgi:hypothetical protein